MSLYPPFAVARNTAEVAQKAQQLVAFQPAPQVSIDFIQGLVYVTGCETSIEVPVAVQRSMHIAQSPARMVDLVHEYWVPMDRPTDLGRMIASLREGKADVTDKKSGSKYRVYFATQEPAQERNRQPRNRPVRNLWGEEDVPPTWYGNILVVKYLYDDLADTMGPNDRVIVDRVVKRAVQEGLLQRRDTGR